MNVSKGKLNDCVFVLRFSSHFLHATEAGDVLVLAWKLAQRLLGNDDFRFQTREVHRCIDLVGWSPTKDDEERFVTRGSLVRAPEEELVRLPDVRSKGRKFKEFAFSRAGHHACVIYDKTREVKVSGKQWIYDIWKANGWDGESQVIRIEFRYDRTCLREMGIEDPYDMLDQLESMWAYSTQNWIRHTIPGNDSNQSRWDTSDLWQVVQAAGNLHMDAEPAVRITELEHDAKRAMAGFVGFAVGWAARARVPLHDIQEDGGGFLAWAYDPMQKYLAEKKTATFGDLLRLKARKLGIRVAA
jgi:hypothetical protein